MFCKQCSKTICVDCVDEHSEQGHPVVSLSKYAAQVVMPAMDAKLSAQKVKGKDDDKALHHELASYLALAKDRESKRQSVLADAISKLTVDRDTAEDSIVDLKQQLHTSSSVRGM